MYGTPLQGVQTDLGGLVGTTNSFLETFLPIFMVSAGLVVAGVILDAALGFFREDEREHLLPELVGYFFGTQRKEDLIDWRHRRKVERLRRYRW